LDNIFFQYLDGMYIRLVPLIIVFHLKMFLFLLLLISFLSLDANIPIYSKIKTLFEKCALIERFKEDDDLFEDGMEFLFITYARNQDEDVLHFSILHVTTKPYDLQHGVENNWNYLRNDLKLVPNFSG
jgi:hypothetical protein